MLSALFRENVCQSDTSAYSDRLGSVTIADEYVEQLGFKHAAVFLIKDADGGGNHLLRLEKPSGHEQEVYGFVKSSDWEAFADSALERTNGYYVVCMNVDSMLTNYVVPEKEVADAKETTQENRSSSEPRGGIMVQNIALV